MVASSWNLFSDGGGQVGSGAAGACIVTNEARGISKNCIIYLGDGTNNEAEILGGLLGLLVISQLLAKGEKPEVHWVCDSEYVLKSATGYINNWQRNGWKTAAKKPVKNQGLWNVYLDLSRTMRIHGEHVRGHTGHEENEACDTACTWAISNAQDHFAFESSPTIQLSGMGEYEQWEVFDGRSFIVLARNWEEPADTKVLSQCLMNFEISTKAPRVRPQSKPRVDLSAVMSELETIRNNLGESAKEKALGRDLKALIKKHLSN